MTTQVSTRSGLFAGQPIKYWIRASRTASLGQSLTPYILGALAGVGALLYNQTSLGEIAISLLLTVVGCLGVALAHLGLNLFDDYFDSGVGAVKRRQEMTDGGIRARMGKCAYLNETEVELKDVRKTATVFIIAALILGMGILFVRGWEVLIFAGIALLLGLLYAGPPFRLSYHGFGELIVGIIFGPLVVGAAFYVACGYVTPLTWWISAPMGLLVANILNAHAIMDFGPDKAANRITFSILLGSERRGYIANIVMMVLAYASILAGVLLGQMPIASLLAFITLPLALEFTKSLGVYVRSLAPLKEGKWSAEQSELAKRKEDEVVKAFEPQKWMGPFGNWERIKTFGIDWFMMRWLLSRNIVMEMAPLLTIAALSPWYLTGLPWT